MRAIVVQGPRVLLFPGITGEDACFRDTLALALPGYAGESVPYPGVSAASALLTSLPLAADRALARIAARACAEHFILIGYSYGGNLAFEVAHRMVRRGQTVELVILIDSALPDTTFSIFEDTPAENVARSRIER